MAYALTDNARVYRKRKFYIFTAIAMIVLISACKTQPKLKVEDEGVIYQHFAAAPFIIVGTIVSSSQVGREIIWHPTPSPSPSGSGTSHDELPEYSLTLLKAKVVIENVLRGEVNQDEVDIYYYSHVGSLGGTPGIGMYGVSGIWAKGDRELFYLKKIDNVLRTYCDIFAPCVTSVFSGAHPGFMLDISKPSSDSLIDLLLTRGEGNTDRGMVKAVLSKSPGFLSREYAIRKWQEIAKYDKSVLVRQAACEQLNGEQLTCPIYEGTLVQGQN